MTTNTELPPRLAAIFDGLSEDEKKTAWKWLGDLGFTAEWISLAFTRLGFGVSASTIRTYRRRALTKESVS